jgi:hypothetical protein
VSGSSDLIGVVHVSGISQELLLFSAQLTILSSFQTSQNWIILNSKSVPNTSTTVVIVSISAV